MTSRFYVNWGQMIGIIGLLIGFVNTSLTNELMPKIMMGISLVCIIVFSLNYRKKGLSSKGDKI